MMMMMMMMMMMPSQVCYSIGTFKPAHTNE
jgi:hypothetical protein